MQRDWKPQVVVTPDLRIHLTPKVASASVLVATHGFPRSSAREGGPEKRFMVVRHPLDRIVSAWTFFCCEPDQGYLYRMNLHTHLGVQFGMDFVPFFDIVLRHHDANDHTRKQVLSTGGHEIDILCRLEDLQKKWVLIMERYQYLKPLPHKHQTKHLDWRSYVKPTMRRLAERVFSEDMELYELAEPARHI